MKQEDCKAIHNLFSEWCGEGTIGTLKHKLAEYVATVRREVWSAAIEIAKEELVPEPCSELDESFNAATRDVITKLEKASASKKEGMNGNDT